MTVKSRKTDMTNTVKLIEPCLEFETEYMDMVGEFLAAGEGKDWGIEHAAKDFAGFVRQRLDWKKGHNLPDSYVPETMFWLIRNDNVILGTSSLRHKLNDKLRKLGGHIGYQIRPSQRKKGYGTMILKLTLAKARQFGLKQVLITCDDENTSSVKIIERNGGILKDKCDRDEPGKLTRRYWIELGLS
jgi:predicted acetyltransferase